MSYNARSWSNPINLDANNLNRLEQGIKNSHDTLEILNEEVSNLQLRYKNTASKINLLVKDSPNILETLNSIQSTIKNNDVNSILSSMDSFLMKSKQSLTDNELIQVYSNLKLNTFLRLDSIKVNGENVVEGSTVNIELPKVDKYLDINSNNAISNRAVTEALDKLKTLKPSGSNTNTNISGLADWALQPNKPQYYFSEILGKPDLITKTEAHKYTDDTFSALVNGAPETLDTLKEISDWIATDEYGTTALINRVSSIEQNYLPLTGGILTGTINLNGPFPQIKTNQTDFVIQSKNGSQFVFNDNEFRPALDFANKLNIGRSDRKFKDGYFSSSLNVPLIKHTSDLGFASETNIFRFGNSSNINNVAVLAGGNFNFFRPGTTNTFDLGTSTQKWKDGYFAGNVNVGKLELTDTWPQIIRTDGADLCISLDGDWDGDVGEYVFSSAGFRPSGSRSGKQSLTGWLNGQFSGTVKAAAFDGNATSATKATQDSDGKVIKDTYIKLNGSNYHAKLTEPSGNGNVAGWRHIATCTLTTWSYAHLILTIKSRHSGNGLLTIGICDTNGNIGTVVGSIRFYGSTDATMYTNAWKMIYNTTTGVVNVYWRFSDYNSCEIKVLSQDRFTTHWNNGEWLTTEPIAGTNEIEYLPIIYDKEYLQLSGGTMQGILNMNNHDITNANKLTFLDPGYGEGIEWDNGNGWRINECPNDLSNTKGDLQFISSNTRRATVYTDGSFESTGYLRSLNDIARKNNNVTYTSNPTANQRSSYYFFDKNNAPYGAMEIYAYTSGVRRLQFNVRNTSGAWATDKGALALEIDSNKNVYAKAPTPVSTANDIQIATTAWVRDSIDITGVQTDIVTLVKNLINTTDVTKSAKYTRWYCRINGTSADNSGSFAVKNIPLNVAFVCEALCTRLVTATDYSYTIRFVGTANNIIYRTYVNQGSKTFAENNNTNSLIWIQDVITTGNQTIAGNKTFSGTINSKDIHITGALYFD